MSHCAPLTSRENHERGFPRFADFAAVRRAA